MKGVVACPQPVEAASAPRIHCEGGQVDLEARAYFALVHIALRDPQTGRLDGGADPRGRGGLGILR